ncbi:MAG: hypothetical protein SAJ12_01580 [Jaaginema sp. PMC 1079.18]|nr:hypothetical protein [Jaaginema sp. PMC 1080.18]MEC4849676.1 hypothetical protein [Jaaginema sp. PMC 1079.18]MEC4866159.1 hypothetical protein [Jaaginema sp. PMC 1078.18]
MKSWEFLIQKHGKNAWFPLKKSKLKLPAGRYRLVAQCDRPHLDVDVRLTHQTLDTTPPQQRSQQRQGRTNSEGLMVIVPFVNFTPGLWEIRASSEIMSELLGENWQKVVKFRVLPQFSHQSSVISQQSSSNVESTEAEITANSPEDAPEAQVEAENAAIPDNASTPAELNWPLPPENREFALSEAENSLDEELETEITANSPEDASAAQIEAESAAIPDNASTPAELHWPLPPENQEFALSEDENSLDEELETEITANSPEDAPEAQIEAESAAIPDNASTPAELHWPLPPENQEFVAPEVENSPIEHRETEITSNASEESLDSPSEARESQETIPNSDRLEPDLKSLLDRSIQNLEEILQQAEQSPEAEDSEDLPTDPPPETTTTNPDDEWLQQIGDRTANLKLHLSLNHDNYVRYGSENLFISGQVDAPASGSNDLNILLTPVSPYSATLRLQYHLRDPQSTAFYDPDRLLDNRQTHALYSTTSPNHESNLPLIFGFNLAIAPEFHQPLILGEAILELTVQNTPNTPPYTRILARQPFTITAALDELLETAFPRETPTSETSNPTPPVPLKTDFVDLAKTPGTGFVASANPQNKQPLPPKLSKNAPKTDTPKRSLDLPPFNPPLDHSPFKAEEVVDLIPPSEETPEPPEPATPEAIAPPTETPASPEVAIGIWDEPLDRDLNLTASENEEIELPEPEPPTNPEADQAFQSLQLQDRFWHRMNSLAEDASFFSTVESPATPETPISETTDSEETDFEAWEETPPPEAQVEDNDEEENSSVIVPPSPSVQLPFEDLLAPPPALRWSREPDSELSETEEDIVINWEQEDEDSNFSDSEFDPQELLDANPETSETVDPNSETDEIADEVLFAPTPSEPEPTPPATEYDNLEIVLDDDQDWYAPPSPQSDTANLSYPDAVRVSAREALGGLRRENNQPIPVPILTIAEGELIAGEPVLVRVKLPPQSGAIYVKLWVIDCQTRHLLDGPRALVDFSSLPSGELETMTQLQVPLGSREIRFEAIAIDIASHRESRKTTIDRIAIPPDLPDVSLDLF